MRVFIAISTLYIFLKSIGYAKYEIEQDNKPAGITSFLLRYVPINIYQLCGYCIK